MKVTMKGNIFKRIGGSIIDGPAESFDSIDFRENEVEDVGAVFTFRERQVQVPRELATYIREIYDLEMKATNDQSRAVSVTEKRKPVRKFLKEHGFDAASLGVASADLVRSVLGL